MARRRTKNTPTAASATPAPTPAPIAAPLPPAVLEGLRQTIARHATGDLAGAVAGYRQALATQPHLALAHHNLGAALRDLGQGEAATAAFRRALELTPDYADAWSNYALCRMDAGAPKAALAAYECALICKPDHVNALSGRGTVLGALGRGAEAEAMQRRALLLDPQHAQALNNLGNALKQQERLDEAVALYESALARMPAEAACHANLGAVLLEVGRIREAIACFYRCIQLNPAIASAYGNLGNALASINDYTTAIDAHRCAVALEPGNPKIHANLGTALKGQGWFGEAEAAFHHALCLDPDYDYPYNNLANLLREQGRLEEALPLYDRALALNPGYMTALSNRLFTLNSLPGWSQVALCAEHRRFQQAFAAALPAPPPYTNQPDPERVLRIGYVSPDLLAHSVAYFVEPLLEAHDRRRFHITGYAGNIRVDDVTRRLQSKADAWRAIAGYNDAELAELIRADGIDILVDLAGHTANNRLISFAHRPAPVQVTAIGYPNTTGLDAIGYRLTDGWVDPLPETLDGHLDDTALYSETLVRLPSGFLCYRPFDGAPEPAPRPATLDPDAPLTFGSFNALSKLPAPVIALWARLLHAVPGARLVLKNTAFADAATCQLFLDRFAAHGITPERLDLLARIDALDGHLGAYRRIDIGLDPFPYNGTTTTCEALWMGVPVITLCGTHHVARVGYSLLARLGLEELVAYDPEDYLARAVALADDRARLGQLSQTLRPRMAASSLCDKEGYARAVEAAYRTLWARWCATAPDPAVTAAHVRPEVDATRLAGAAPGRAGLPDLRPTVLFDHGVARVRQNDLEGAAAAFRAALALQTHFPEAQLNLGTVLKRQGQPAAAAAAFRAALAQRADYAAAHAGLGAALLELGRVPEAEAACRTALLCDPALVNGHVNLALVLSARQDNEAALEPLRRALEIGPPNPDVYNNLAVLLSGLGRLDEAVAACENALALREDYVEALANLASIQTAQGHLHAAAATHRRVAELRPDLAHAISNLLFALNYDDTLSAEAVFAEHRRWGAHLACNITPLPPPDNLPDPERRLKIGYVSADFYGHSVSFFILPLLAAHDRRQVEVFCYADSTGEDWFTEALRRHSDHWRRCNGLDAATLAAQIRADGIDVLVDLSGHTARNRLTTFARRPAPVQMSWLGYPHTTGLPAMDVRLSDAIADPYGSADPFCTERLYRLPRGFLCYRPGPKVPPVAPPPVLSRDHISFGSFNNLSKVTPPTIAVWARVLHAVPGAVLRLKAKALADPATRARLEAAFAAQGIAAERLDILSWQPYLKNHLALYDLVDIALDTFPYHGTTTTCEALWMGVPVISRVGDRHAARVGASLLTQVGLTGLIAVDDADYVARAVELASDPAGLTALRTGLRARLEASPLRDEAGFARAMEEAFRQAWRRWCREQRTHPPLPSPTATATSLAETAGPPGTTETAGTAEAATLLASAIRHHQAGDSAAAAPLYRRVLALAPQTAQAWNLLGVIAAQQGDFPAARILLEQAVALAPDDPTAHNNLGGVLREAGAFTAAIRCFRHALWLNPAYTDARDNLAHTRED